VQVNQPLQASEASLAPDAPGGCHDQLPLGQRQSLEYDRRAPSHMSYGQQGAASGSVGLENPRGQVAGTRMKGRVDSAAQAGWTSWTYAAEGLRGNPLQQKQPQHVVHHHYLHQQQPHQHQHHQPFMYPQHYHQEQHGHTVKRSYTSQHQPLQLGQVACDCGADRCSYHGMTDRCGFSNHNSKYMYNINNKRPRVPLLAGD
jgi:hypothetical protein